MIISHSRKFIFIHIPKTAGLSITDALSKYNFNRNYMNRMLALFKIYPRVYMESFKDERFHVRRHLTAKMIKDQLNDLGRGDVFEKYFKFSFVRNPFAAMVSSYKYVMASSDPGHVSHKSSDFINMRTKYNSFEDFLRFRVNEFPISFYSYLYDDSNGQCLVDFVGKVENLQEDFDKVCRSVDLPLMELRRVNATKLDDFKVYYNAELASLLVDSYKKDFELMGYSKDIESY